MCVLLSHAPFWKPTQEEGRRAERSPDHSRPLCSFKLLNSLSNQRKKEKEKKQKNKKTEQTSANRGDGCGARAVPSVWLTREYQMKCLW